MTGGSFRGFLRGAAPGRVGGCPRTPPGALPLDPVGGSAPLPLLKKAGENQLENFFGFPAKYAGPPLMGSGGLVLFVGSRGRKGVADDSFGRWKTATARGAAAFGRPGGPRAPGPAKQKSRGRRQSLRPCFSGRFAPRRRPRAPQRLPPPPRRRTSSGPMAVAHGKQGDGTDPGVLSPNAKRATKRRRSNRPPRSFAFNTAP